MSDELRQRIESLLDREGVVYAFLPPRGRHRSLVIEHGGMTRRLFLPCTPGRGRSIENSIALVKRALRGTP